MSEARPSLDHLRAAVREVEEVRHGRALLRRLEGDRRRGAIALAEKLERRIESLHEERRRIAGLLQFRQSLMRRGARFVAGVDEVGVGPLAGPVVAAAVVLPGRVELPGLDDSKRLSAAARERLDRAIRAQAVSLSIGAASHREIDRLNIYHAALLAMRRAVEGLGCVPDHVLVDARRIPDIAIPQTAMVNGDARDASIAAASIVAKVHRDALMTDLDRRHPGYDFARHKGYATATHRRALARLGPCAIHRRSFAPCATR